MQNVLFLLGGLLLGIAAIVFAAVAWAQFGVGGRAALLAVFTLAALAAPPVALRRGLRGTAETVAAVGLVLIPLDGYAAWYINLFGVTAFAPARYAGVVFAAAAAIAAGYALLNGPGFAGLRRAAARRAGPDGAISTTGLTGPRFVALVFAQPALPLLVAPAHPGPAGWTLTFGALAALDLAVRRARIAPRAQAVAGIAPRAQAVAGIAPRAQAVAGIAPRAQGVAGIAPLAYVFAGIATVVALFPALIAAVRTLGAAHPFLHAAWTATVPGPGWRLPAALAVVTAALWLSAPPRLRTSALVAGVSAVALALPSGLHLPWWNGPILDLVVVAALLAPTFRRTAPALAAPAGRVAALPAAASPTAASSAASAVMLGTRVAASAADSAVTVGGRVAASASDSAVALGARASTSASVAAVITLIGQVIASVVLGAHAIATGFGRPSLAAAVLTAIALLGVVLRLTAKARNVGHAEAREADEPAPAGVRPAGVRRALGLLIALLPVPALAWAAAVALGLHGDDRAVLVAAGLGVVLVAGAALGARGERLGFGLSLLAGWGVALVCPAGTVLEAYTLTASGLALAAALLARRDRAPSWIVLGPALGVGLAPSLISVLAGGEQHLRRLLLGLAALAILLVGARLRLRAPVVAGGGALALVALHELVLVWDLVPRWIPLAAGGLLLVVLAATLERRRRDVAWVRHALGRMT